jgi:hypothetical protein
MACDGLHQQIPPVRALGHEYVAINHPDRYSTHEEQPWRIVGVVDGTILTYDPAPPVKAPGKLDSGEFGEFWSGDPFIVKSQDADHPFYVASYMTGCMQYTQASDNDCRGDPEFVNVVPPQQYLPSYTFFTDPTYSETHLIVVRKRSRDAFADVDLDCAGTLGEWQNLGTDYQWTYFTVTSGNFEKNGDCDNGRHEIKSGGLFGLTVWAWGSAATGGSFGANGAEPGFYTQAVSYAYPAGASVQPITNVVVPPSVR